MSATAAAKRSPINDAVTRAQEGRARLWDSYRLRPCGVAPQASLSPEQAARNDELYDDLDFQLVAIEALQEGLRRASKLMGLAGEQLTILNDPNDPAVAHLIKALAEAVGELS